MRPVRWKRAQSRRPDAPPNQSARILGADGWSQCELRDLTVETRLGRGAAESYFRDG